MRCRRVRMRKLAVATYVAVKIMLTESNSALASFLKLTVTESCHNKRCNVGLKSTHLHPKLQILANLSRLVLIVRNWLPISS